MWTLLLALLSAGCGDTDTTDDTATGDSAATTDTVDTQDTEDTVPAGPRGCVQGRLRDFDNNAAGDLAVAAWYPEGCTELDSSTSAVDGKFCLDGLPVGYEVEVQATFGTRCTWVHSRLETTDRKGTCGDASCLDLGSWFECEGETATCP